MMKTIFCILLAVIALSAPTLIFAKGFSHGSLSSRGGTHYVKPYVKKKSGTFVQGHRASNPRSAMHCKNNICY